MPELLPSEPVTAAGRNSHLKEITKVAVVSPQVHMIADERCLNGRMRVASVGGCAAQAPPYEVQ
jgi:hypothetical protein